MLEDEVHMTSRLLYILLVGLSASALFIAGCGDSSGTSEPTPEPDTSIDDTQTPTDVDVDTTQPPTSTGPSRAAVVSGGGLRESDNYKLNVTVGGPVSSHALESDQYKLTLGVAAGQ